MSIVYLSDAKARRPLNAPCTIILYGHSLRDATGRSVEPRASFCLTHGDYQNAIEGFRDEGGFYASSPDGLWFCPWPPAAIQICFDNGDVEDPAS